MEGWAQARDEAIHYLFLYVATKARDSVLRLLLSVACSTCSKAHTTPEKKARGLIPRLCGRRHGLGTNETRNEATLSLLVATSAGVK